MRRLELDSLRGIAALIVLAYHVLAINILVFAQGSQFQPISSQIGTILAYSPLRFFWSGGEAVWLFFVLSGFVLTSATANLAFRWGAYFPSRLVRLYIPVSFAVAITFASIRFIPHILTDSNESFLGDAATTYTLASVINDLIVITGPTNTLGPLWSLRWEILFSLLLPTYVFAVRTHRNTWLVVATIGFLCGFWYKNEFLMYMPMFYFGAWLSTVEFGSFTAYIHLRIPSTLLRFLLGIFFITTAITLISSFWIWGAQFASTPLSFIPSSMFFAPFKIVGILLLMFIVMISVRLTKLLSHKSFVFFGTISFSLYLVHWPVIVSATFLMGPGWPAVCVGVVLSLLISIVFYYLIEKRAHNLSRNIAQKIRLNSGIYSGYPI